ncbi:MAG: translation initiation factor [Opitutaceae bacterium]
MSERKISKISTDGSADELAHNPFGGLELGGLPDGPKKPQTIHRPKDKKPKSKGRVEVRREKAGRGGKTVTTLREFPTHIPLGELDQLAFELKKTCACGGTHKHRVVELQGDVCDRVIMDLEKRGYKPVRAGG